MRNFLIATLIFFSATSAFSASSGTGFFVSSSGHILTNAHVIEGAENILVRTKAGDSFTARVVAIDNNNDLALIKVETQSKPLQIKSIEGLEKGAKVFTIGFPNPYLQGLEAKYTEGVISSFSGLRDTPNVMQVTVPIQPGNSGGPLIDDKGNVVGIIVAKINALAVAARQDYIPENVNFAIKSDYAIPLILSIPAGQRDMQRSRVTVRDVEAATVLIVSAKDYASKPPIDEPVEPAYETTTLERERGTLAFSGVRFDLVDAYLEVVSIAPRSESFRTTLRLGDRLLECINYEKNKIYAVDDIKRCRANSTDFYTLKVLRYGTDAVASIYDKSP